MSFQIYHIDRRISEHIVLLRHIHQLDTSVLVNHRKDRRQTSYIHTPDQLNPRGGQVSLVFLGVSHENNIERTSTHSVSVFGSSTDQFLYDESVIKFTKKEDRSSEDPFLQCEDDD